MSPKLSTRNQQNDVCATKNTPTVKTHAPLKRNTCSSIGDRKVQRLTNLPTSRSKSPLQHKTDSPRISKECHHSCAELHCVTCGSECPYRTRKCRSSVRMALESGQGPTCWRTPHFATRFTAHKMSTTSVGGSGAPFSVTTPQLSRLNSSSSDWTRHPLKTNNGHTFTCACVHAYTRTRIGPTTRDPPQTTTQARARAHGGGQNEGMLTPTHIAS